MRLRLRTLTFVLAGFLAHAPHAANAQGFTIFAAASLKEALDDAVEAYRKSGRVVVSYAATSALAKQIVSGAPADLFISADLAWMDYVEKRNLIRVGTRRNLLRNGLVLIAPAASDARVQIEARFPLGRLLGSGRLAIADPDSVPAGKYGKAALQALGVWQDVERKLAPAQNVRAALLLVSRGEAPLGIVYRTDAAAEPRVRTVGSFPESSHPPIVYPAAVTVSGKPGAAAFLLWLEGPEGKRAFESHGFTAY